MCFWTPCVWRAVATSSPREYINTYTVADGNESFCNSVGELVLRQLSLWQDCKCYRYISLSLFSSVQWWWWRYNHKGWCCTFLFLNRALRSEYKKVKITQALWSVSIIFWECSPTSANAHEYHSQVMLSPVYIRPHTLQLLTPLKLAALAYQDGPGRLQQNAKYCMQSFITVCKPAFWHCHTFCP